MKRITLFLFLLIGLGMLRGVAQLPCPHDTLVNGGQPLGDFQWSGAGDPTIGECPTCVPFNRMYSWDLLDTGNLLVIHGNFFPPCDTVEIRIVQDCRWVYKDTCLVLPLTGSGCEFILDIDPPANAQILVYWRSSGTDSIGVIGNEVNDGSPLTMILYDMDTCAILNHVPEPGGAGDTPPLYTHYFTRASSRDYPAEPGVYIVSWPESPYRPREKIVILH